MQKQITLSIDEKIYDSLYQEFDNQKISAFIENLLKNMLMLNKKSTETQYINDYQAMANDKERELLANEWVDGLALDGKKDWDNEAW